jgi:KipI family sensor histidine kinase inhibitor
VTEPHIRLLADTVVLVEYEPVLNEDVNARALALSDAVRQRSMAGVIDVVPAYASVAVHVDPRRTALETIVSELRELARDAAPIQNPVLPAAIDVPVTYGGEDGPDLASVAAWSGLTEADVIDRHASRIYRVFMIGFLPGFPYMGLVDDTIAMPRHRTPRTRVPAGSVGIAGRQTGIYPTDSPGGWQVIGRASCTLFDAARHPPALLAPGQRVRFVPIESSRTAVPTGGRP